MVMRYWLKVFFDDALSLAHGLKCQFLIGQRENPVRDFFNRFGGSGLRLASYFDGGPFGTLSLLICYQQPKESIVSNTSVADECRKTYYGTLIGICTAESEADDPSCHRSPGRSRGVFLHGHFTLPITIGTTVGAKGIKKRAATTDRAVAQHHDAEFAAFKAVQSLRLSCVKPVPNHLVAPLCQMMTRSLAGIDGNVFASRADSGFVLGCRFVPMGRRVLSVFEARCPSLWLGVS